MIMGRRKALSNTQFADLVATQWIKESTWPIVNGVRIDVASLEKVLYASSEKHPPELSPEQIQYYLTSMRNTGSTDFLQTA